jgi:hypothetical protein
MSLLQALDLQLPAGGGAKASPVKGGAEGSKSQTQRLHDAADSWRETHRQANQRLEALKAAVKAHYADGHSALLDEIEAGLAKLDGVLDNVDHRLADSLVRAGNAGDEARRAELAQAKAMLTQYIGYVKSESLVAHIDQNPFGVKTDFRVLLAAGLTSAAKAIG